MGSIFYLVLSTAALYAFFSHKSTLEKIPGTSEISEKTDPSKKQCIFCGENFRKRQVVLETDCYFLSVDSAPIQHGHLIATPKRHCQVLTELNQEESKELAKVAVYAAAYFKEMQGTDNYILLQKNGKSAGQSIEHLHFHFIPMRTSSPLLQIASQIKVLAKIILGSRPMKDSELEPVVKEARTYFSLGEENRPDHHKKSPLTL